MKITLDPNSVEDYKVFLQIKELPVHSFCGREATFPDEYSSRLGLKPKKATTTPYKPMPRLFDYQRDIAAIAIRRQKFGCFADPGLGKTLIMWEFAFHAAGCLSRGKKVLIVSPLMIINQSIKEAGVFYGQNVPAIEKVRAADLQKWIASGTSQIGITNFEAITDEIKNDGRIGCIAIDESSMLKSAYGKWGTRLIELGRGVDWKLCLTGTPAPNDRVEYANHAVFLDRFPTVNSFLAKYFINRGETSNRWDMKAHAVGAFYRDLSHWCIFLSNPATYGWKDNTTPLPPIHTHILDVPLTDAQRFDAMDVSGNLFGIPSGIGSRQKIATIAKSKDGNRPQFIYDLIKKETTPAIIWAKYNPEQEELARRLPEAANISGDTPEDRRIELIEDYQNGRRNELLSKIKILGFGLNFQMCRRMIFSTIQDSFEDFKQAVKRANRTGSLWPLDVYIPVTELERPMLETVLSKAARVQADTEEQERLFKGVFQC